ncbi:MAG: class I SAM-dependent methyltransferase [Polyangiaceae bacterium]
MSWYDVFASFYDSSLERLYLPFRKAATERLALAAGQRVLDAACGTGQSLDLLSEGVGAQGVVVGVDLSKGMLEQAQKRISRKSLSNVRLFEGSLLELDRSKLAEHLEPSRGFDRVLAFLVMSALPDWEDATARLWDLLEPGGTLMIVDAHTDSLGIQGRLVNLTARADIRRKVWSKLEQLSHDFTLERLDAPYSVGGDMIIAKGVKPQTKS